MIHTSTNSFRKTLSSASGLRSFEGRPLWLPRDPLSFRAFFEKRRCAYALAEIREPAAAEPEQVVHSLLARLRP